ncbi:zinc finger protein 208-like isoform X2 [Ruditapes philippinarum]|uniref:zinc finger protein 208-like isoform X2 n=1 Tax=Ruditapes philippinarum TaxID=129788 RepID=UPI00295B988D|nr:zinc finger protein 208-like isoform X2 [Ruditapes philippinarum]
MAFLLDSHQEEIEYVYPFICGFCGYGSSSIDVFHHHFETHSENIPSSVFHRCEQDDTVYNDTELSLNIGSYCCKTCNHAFPTVCFLLKHLEDDSNTDKYIMDLQTKTAYPLTSLCTSVLSHSFDDENSSYFASKKSLSGKWSSSPKMSKNHVPNRNGANTKSPSRGGKCGPKQTSENGLEIHSMDEILQQVENQQRAAINSNMGQGYGGVAQSYDDNDNDDGDTSVVSLIPETILTKPSIKRKKTSGAKTPKRSKRGEWFSCKFCRMSFRYEHKKIDHEKEHDTVEGNHKYTPDKLCTCELCGCVMLKLKVHLHICPLKDRHRRPRAKSGEPKKDKDQTLVSCPYCSRVLKKYMLSHHVRETHMEHEPVTCDTCGKVFKHKYALSKHQIVHRARSRFICSKCGKGMQTGTKLRIHMLSHDDVRTFQCDLCPAKYKFPKNLKYHKERIHAGKKEMFQCDKCPKRYSHRDSLMHHLKHGHDLWANPEQEKISKEKVAEKAAKRNKTPNRPESYTCVICNEVEKTRGGLSEHMKIHKKENTEDPLPYLCNECPLKYSTIDGLRRHKRNKHGPQAGTLHFCELCSRSFTNPDSLRMHNIRNHKPGSKTLICGWEGCKRRFSDETKLENHRKTHSGGKVYQCEKCSKTFTSLSGFSYHWRSQHPKVYKLPECPKEQEEVGPANADDQLPTANQSDIVQHAGDIQQHLEDHSYMNTETYIACRTEDFDSSLTNAGVEDVTKTANSPMVVDVNKTEDTNSTVNIKRSIEDSVNDTNQTIAVMNVDTCNKSSGKDAGITKKVSKPKVIRLSKVIGQDELDKTPDTKKTEENVIHLTFDQNQMITKQNEVNLGQNNVSKDQASKGAELKNVNKVNALHKGKVLKTLIMKNVEGRDYKELFDPDVGGSNSSVKSMTLYLSSDNKQSSEQPVKRPVKIILKKV